MHGLPTAKELFAPLQSFLDPSLRLIAFDLNDYGQSDKLSHIRTKMLGAGMSHQQRADVLDELRAHLNLTSFILVTHDLGSSVGVDYMGKYAQYVDKFIISSPPVYPDFVEPPIVKLLRIPYLGELLVRLGKDQLFGIGIRQGLVHKDRFSTELQMAFAAPFSGPEGWAALLRNLRWGRPNAFFTNYPHIIQSINAPTLIIQGRYDPYIPHDQVLRLHHNIPNSKLLFIEDGAHFLPIDTPKQMASAINAFVFPI